MNPSTALKNAGHFSPKSIPPGPPPSSPPQSSSPFPAVSVPPVMAVPKSPQLPANPPFNPVPPNPPLNPLPPPSSSSYASSSSLSSPLPANPPPVVIYHPPSSPPPTSSFLSKFWGTKHSAASWRVHDSSKKGHVVGWARQKGSKNPIKTAIALRQDAKYGGGKGEDIIGEVGQDLPEREGYGDERRVGKFKIEKGKVLFAYF